MFTLEGSYLFNNGIIGVGPMVTGVLSPDASMTEAQRQEPFAVYAGINSLLKISPKYQFEMNAQQRIDRLGRTNILGNIGFRINFN
jgi:hypothetical protein